MSGQTLAVTQKSRSDIAPFEIEWGYGDIWVGTLRERFRGRWSRLHQRGMESSMGKAMSAMPDIPGIHMRLDTKRLTVTTHDPLEKDRDRLDKIAAVMKQAGWGSDLKLKAVKKSERTLDKDMFKTLLVELRKMEDLHPEDQKLFHVVNGTLPTMAEIDSIDGDELNSPGSAFVRAKYKKDADQVGKILHALREAGIGVI